MVEAVKEQHSCCLNNLNDEILCYSTNDCFSWEKLLEGQNKKKQNLESAIEYTANSRGFIENHIQNQMVLISKVEVETTRPLATKIATDDWEELVICSRK
jgi:hypothetical protein